jgi:hypothetical protein
MIIVKIFFKVFDFLVYKSSQEMSTHVINPLTGRKVHVGKDVYKTLVNDGHFTRKEQIEHQRQLKAATVYKNIPQNEFCGPDGISFPVNTAGRAKAAIPYSRYAGKDRKNVIACVAQKSRKKCNDGDKGYCSIAEDAEQIVRTGYSKSGKRII